MLEEEGDEPTVDFEHAGDDAHASAADQRERDEEQSDERCGKSPEVHKSSAHGDIVVIRRSGQAVDKLPGARSGMFRVPGATARHRGRSLGAACELARQRAQADHPANTLST